MSTWRVPGSRRSKYGNVPTDGYHSKKERERARDLEILQLAGHISDLEKQVPFVLSEAPRVTYICDFRYRENGRDVVEDVKGFVTATARIKLAWFQQRYPEYELRIT